MLKQSHRSELSSNMLGSATGAGAATSPVGHGTHHSGQDPGSKSSAASATDSAHPGNGLRKANQPSLVTAKKLDSIPATSMNVRLTTAHAVHLTRNSLPSDVRERSVHALNGILTEAIDLSMSARHAYWNVRGANFGAVHGLFGSVWEEMNDQIDGFGARIAGLGGIAGGTVQQIAGQTELSPYPINTFEAQEHLDLIADRLSQLGGSARSAARKLNASGDMISTDLMVDMCATIDKLLWLTESHVTKPS